ncbi:MAG: ferritin-like domain-containing protein [bacterium]
MKNMMDSLIATLNSDLRNEWTHLRFYLYHASAVVGLHCSELKELFLEEAAGEMKHVTAFSDLIVGLGGMPTDESNFFPKFTNPVEIINHAIKLEEEVVSNYAQRIKEIREEYQITDPNAKWIEIFLEEQIQKSREDVDHLKQLVKGLN